MSWVGRSLLSIDELSRSEVDQIFSLAKVFKFHVQQGQVPPIVNREFAATRVVSEVFFETSTRTRLSFQMACHRLGVKVHGMDLLSGSSVKKGESIVETIENIAAMGADLLVVRSGGGTDVDQCLRDLPMPVINAGAGSIGHPTQALLDLMTLLEWRSQVEGLKLLFVGDVRHSRVANSNLPLLRLFGVQVAYCAPEAFAPNEPTWSSIPSFATLDEGLKWCDVVMGLRVQEERHQGAGGYDREKYIEHYRLDAKSLNHLSPQGLILHPGPFLAGVDLAREVLEDPRCRIREQVTNGVYVRMALISLLLGIEVKK